MSRWLLALVSCAVLGAGINGCGSSDDDGNGLFKSGVDGNAELKDLTPDQRVTLCTKQAKYVHATVDTTSLMRFVCAFTPGVLFATTDEACEASLQQCISATAVQVNVQVTDEANVATVCQSFPVSQCAGTVSQYENCVDQAANVQLTIGTDFACGKRTQYQSSPTVGVDACNAVGPACTAVTNPPVIR